LSLEITYLDIGSRLPYRNPIPIIYREGWTLQLSWNKIVFLFDLVTNLGSCPIFPPTCYVTSLSDFDAMPKKRYDDEALRRKALGLKRLRTL